MKVRKEQGDLAVVTVGYASIVPLNLAVVLLGTPFRSPSSLSGNNSHVKYPLSNLLNLNTLENVFKNVSLKVKKR